MAAKTSAAETKRRLAALERTKRPGQVNGNISEAAGILKNVSNSTLSRWLLTKGIKVGNAPSFTKEQCIEEFKRLVKDLGRIPVRDEWRNISAQAVAWRTHWRKYEDFIADAQVEAAPDPIKQRELLLKALRGAATLESIAQRLRVSRGQALDMCDKLREDGFTIIQRGDRFALDATPVQLAHNDELHLYESDAQGKYRFGFVTDNHLGSKYAREDVLHDLYDWFAREGVERVYNAGNWIDGEARFNRHDLLVHGMDEQLAYFAKRYPQRPGMTTYYVAGDDHEGWYAKDAGVDIGKRAEQTARSMGRTDLRYIGYMEAFIRLRHKVSGAESHMMVVHPGGGSSYAISYAPQKFVEALQGGEKPAVVMFGHWHKMDCFNYRNVWIMQGGTTEDQTPFMRKLKLEAHVGGMIVELEQEKNGSIPICVPRMKRYFDRGFYNNQFNMAGDISRPARV